jgi:hypothetical protein
MKVEVNLIESLDDITVGQFQDYQSKLKVDENGSPTIDERTQNSHALKIFCGLPYDIQPQTKAHQLNDLLNRIGDAFGKVQPFQQRFKMDGVEYGFIPKLDDITTDEYADLDQYINDISNAHKAMAVMYRPITRTHKDLYDIAFYNGTSQTADIMKKAPLSVYLGAQVFFWNLGIELSSYILNSSEKAKKSTNTQTSVKTSPKNGDGMELLTRQLITILPSMKL